MAFVDIPGWPWSYPSGIDQGSTTANFGTALTIDDTAEKVAFIIRAPKDGVLNRVGFKLSTVAQAPTNGLTVSFQDVDTAGDPDGTQDQTRLVPVGDISTGAWVETGLITSTGADGGTKRTVTKGEVLAVVIEFASFSASDSVIISSTFSGPFSVVGRGSHYASLFTASWAKQVSSQSIVLGLQYSDNVWVPMANVLPVTAAVTTTFQDSTNPDENGMKFTLPVPMRATGFVAHTTGGVATNGTHQYHLYDASDNVLASSTVIDPDQHAAVGNGGVKYYPFASVADTVELSADTTYRVAIRATGSANFSMHGIQAPTTSYLTAFPWGTSSVATSRNDGAGSWTDDTTGIQYAIGLQIDAIDPVKGETGFTAAMLNRASLFGARWRRRAGL